MRKIKMATKVAAKKVLVLGMVLSMLAGLTACGENNEKQDRMTTSQAISTEKEVDVDVVEPNDHIDEVFSEETTEVTTEEVTEATTEATTEAANGGYTYTTYGVEVTLPVNIDDYIHTSEYADSIEVFDAVKLGEDFGWEYDPHMSVFRYYGDNDMEIELRVEGGDTIIPGFEDYFYGDSVVTIAFFSYRIARTSSPVDYYYSDNELSHSTTNVGYNMDSANCQYVIFSDGSELVASQDDAILVALFLSFTKEHPGENPMGYFDFSSFITGGNSNINVNDYTFLR